jgi:hypothetical protein
MFGANNFADRPNGSLCCPFCPCHAERTKLHTGNLRQTAQFSDVGHQHLFKAGELTVLQAGEADLELHEPTLLFYPRGRNHSFVVDPERGADLVCATVELGGAEGNPIGQGMPKVMKAHAGLYSGVRWEIGWEICRP